MASYNKEKMTELDFRLLQKKYSTEELEEVLAKIDDDYPVQYAIGDVDFLGCKIGVDERVLIPRFETELLVVKLLELISQKGFSNPVILDICSGSGCIAISLQKKLGKCAVYGLDKSGLALELAKENARENDSIVTFLEMDVLEGITLSEKCDVLVSNPPYVRRDEPVSLNTRYEPEMALYPEGEDIIFYKKILDESHRLMKEKSIIAFEIGSEQGSSVCELARKHYKDAEIVLAQDYAGYDRYVFILIGCE